MHGTDEDIEYNDVETRLKYNSMKTQRQFSLNYNFHNGINKAWVRCGVQHSRKENGLLVFGQMSAMQRDESK